MDTGCLRSAAPFLFGILIIFFDVAADASGLIVPRSGISLKSNHSYQVQAPALSCVEDRLVGYVEISVRSDHAAGKLLFSV